MTHEPITPPEKPMPASGRAFAISAGCVMIVNGTWHTLFFGGILLNGFAGMLMLMCAPIWLPLGVLGSAGIAASIAHSERREPLRTFAYAMFYNTVLTGAVLPIGLLIAMSIGIVSQ